MGFSTAEIKHSSNFHVPRLPSPAFTRNSKGPFTARTPNPAHAPVTEPRKPAGLETIPPHTSRAKRGDSSSQLIAPDQPDVEALEDLHPHIQLDFPSFHASMDNPLLYFLSQSETAHLQFRENSLRRVGPA